MDFLKIKLSGGSQLSLFFLDNDDEAFAWRTTNYTYFREVAFTAKDFLPISDSSMSSERAFFAAGRLVTPFRTSFSHDSVQAHVCLSS